ncbi:MAG: pseudouridine synthase, partial [Betaproteobacteria bacterium]|nr:pseudouridine synthase [Betaproteobacteria bacterium]
AGERRVSVHAEGQSAATRVKPLARGEDFSMLELRLLTGRTHQIRVHLAHAGYPIVGDDKYGDFDLNREWVRRGVKRLLLHARRLAFRHPATLEPVRFEAPLPEDLARFVASHFDGKAIG